MTRRVEEDAKTIAELTLKAKRPRSRATGTQTASRAGIGAETEEEEKAKLRDSSKKEGSRGRRQRSKPRRGATSIDVGAGQPMAKLSESDSKKDDNTRSTIGDNMESSIDIIKEEPSQDQAQDLACDPENVISMEGSKQERDSL